MQGAYVHAGGHACSGHERMRVDVHAAALAAAGHACMQVDMPGYQAAMEAAREKSRAGWTLLSHPCGDVS